MKAAGRVTASISAVTINADRAAPFLDPDTASVAVVPQARTFGAPLTPPTRRITAPAAVRPRHRGMARGGWVALVVGIAAVVAGCYRFRVEASGGTLRALVPIGTHLPLGGELFVLGGAVICIAAVLALVASRRHRPTR